MFTIQFLALLSREIGLWTCGWCSFDIAGTSGVASVDNTKLTKRVDLLQRYLDHNDTLELQALYALQALVHKLEHPPGLWSYNTILLSVEYYSRMTILWYPKFVMIFHTEDNLLNLLNSSLLKLETIKNPEENLACKSLCSW